MHKIQFLMALLAAGIFCSRSYGAFEIKDYGCENISCGSAGIASNITSFAVFINPAKIGLNPNADINLFYRNFYGLKEINQISLAGHFRLFRLPAGFGISTFGNQLYRETEIRTAIGVELIQQIRMGISLNLYYLDIRNYGSTMTFGFDFAFMKHINDVVSAAFVVSNLNEPEIGHTDERIPVRYSVGFAYKPLKIMSLSFDIVKDENFEFDYRTGVQYRLSSWLAISCGFRELVNTVSAGLEVFNDNYNLNYAFQYHPDLGGSNSMSIGYVF